VGAAAHPRLLLDQRDVESLQLPIAGPFAARWKGYRAEADRALGANLELPPRGGNWELMLHDEDVTPERRLIAHHICLELPDVPAAERTLKSRTLPPVCKPMTAPKVGRNGKRLINLFDPDGTRVKVMEPATADGKPVPPSTAPVPTTQPR
jgi:hypothetical protein